MAGINYILCPHLGAHEVPQVPANEGMLVWLSPMNQPDPSALCLCSVCKAVVSDNVISALIGRAISFGTAQGLSHAKYR